AALRLQVPPALRDPGVALLVADGDADAGGGRVAEAEVGEGGGRREGRGGEQAERGKAPPWPKCRGSVHAPRYPQACPKSIRFISRQQPRQCQRGWPASR